MSDYSELKARAEAMIGLDDIPLAPDVILSMIATIDVLRNDTESRCEWADEASAEIDRLQNIEIERDQFKAENAGLKTGYEAYEQTVKELRAEVEALRRGIDPKWASMDQTFVIEFLRHRSVFDAENIDRMIQFAVESAQYVQLNPGKGEQS